MEQLFGETTEKREEESFPALYEITVFWPAVDLLCRKW